MVHRVYLKLPLKLISKFAFLLLHSVPFCAIQAATNHNVRFLLKHRNDLGGIECAALKLESYNASIALYRAITEKHAFYSCETVRSAVTSQFVRDLKGTIASFFNENTDLGTILKWMKIEKGNFLTLSIVICR